VRAIGETGLDYYRDHAPHDDQRRAFEAQLDLARELGLPVVIHTRAAEQDTFAILRERAEGLTVVLHCFSAPERPHPPVPGRDPDGVGVRGGEPRRGAWVPAHDRRHLVVGISQRQCSGRGVAIDPDGGEPRDPGRAGTLDQHVGRRLAQVEMAVCVDHEGP
jgi:hypothetical protein